MSEITDILNKLKGTEEAEILTEMEASYERISKEQSEWFSKSKFSCVDGCGECCRNFEPDLRDCEALYMAAWLLENKPETAEKVAAGEFPYPENKGCLFWDENNAYHCTIYNSRAFICRLFGATGNRSKNGEIVWKPCKFYPVEKLAEHNPPLAHKQYSQNEVEQAFGVLPPVMSDLMEDAVSFEPDNQDTKIIRKILPETIQRLKWIISMNNL